MHSLTLPISIGRMGEVKGFLLKDQNLLSMMKLFAEEPLVAGCFHFNSKFISKSSPPIWKFTPCHVIPGSVSGYTDQPG